MAAIPHPYLYLQSEEKQSQFDQYPLANLSPHQRTLKIIITLSEQFSSIQGKPLTFPHSVGGIVV